MNGLVAEIIWKSTVVLAAAFAAAYALRHGSAAVRHFVWTAAFTVLLALPLVVATAPKWGLRPAPAPAAPVRLAAPAPLAARSTPAPAAPARTGGGSSAPLLFLALYLAGAVLAAGRLAAGIVRTAKMVRVAGVAAHAEGTVESLRRALGIGRRVRTLESAEAAVPMAWGLVRPVALLPDTAREWPAARLHSALLHELVHVQRHDLLAQTVAQAVCCLYWFHPLAWLAARELRKERERACDDAVLGRGVPAPEYAGHLMEMVRAMASRRASLADAPAMAETSDLESRVRALLDRGRSRAPLTRRMAMTVAALAVALLAPVATMTTHAQATRGALAGIVTDPSGSRVPGCSVTVKNLDGTNQEVARVNAAGEYVFTAIPPGRYSIEVSARGFKIGNAEVVVTAGTAARADVALALGSVSEAVTVRAPRTAPAPAAAQAIRSPQRIPIGGNVQVARLLSQVRPVYPPELQQQGVTGTVMIQAIISKTGEVLSPMVLNTDVPPAMAQAALDAVKQWRYQPTLLNGQPVEIVTKIDISFELDDGRAGMQKLAPGATAPVLLAKVEPEYTEEARKAKYQGTVVLQVVVTEQGVPTDMRVVQSLGLGLDEAAIAAVRKWRFKPGMLNGQPVATSARLEVPFRLL